MDWKEKIIAGVAAHEAEYIRTADAIWDHPEIHFQEHASSGLLKTLLRTNGFAVEERLDGMPTAFRASWGTGRPVIAFLAEYDALAGMSQQAGATTCTPLEAGQPGHGCGHNLLGTGACAAAITVKELLAAQQLPGTVVCFGCPAEETGSAKAFMARDGVFNGLDAILSWHPWDYTGIWPGGSLANVKLQFRFHGKRAHAAASPELGRSALDALELMNVGVQFLREHIPQDARVHYAITDAGGKAANVVQSYAEAVYLVRAARLEQLADIQQRVIDCARGAALMTGTNVEVQFIKGCSNLLLNTELDRLLVSSMEALGAPQYTEEERSFAASLQETLEHTEDTLRLISRPCSPADRRSILAHRGESIYGFVAPYAPSEAPLVTISTDVGDASWFAPTAQMSAAAWPAGTPAHSWQAVAVGKSSMAHKAMLFAARSLALTAQRLMTEPDLLR